MKRDAKTDLVSLARDQGGPRWLNASERDLLRFALDRFGEPLAAFLLTGLREDVTTRRRRFTVIFDDRQGARYERRITVTAEPRAQGLRPRLPRGKEPLAMLAFLHLLVEGRKLSSFAVSYEPAEVLQLLNWEDTEKTQDFLDDTVARYFCLDYGWQLSRNELAAQDLSSHRGAACFISGSTVHTAEEAGQVRRLLSEVRFAEEFVRELINRSLFGIRWDGVRSLKYVDS